MSRLMVRMRSGDRSGLTLMEVMLAMAIFLIGSVSIIGLFVAASVLHADAVNRRTASFIAEELLAEVNAKPFCEVFAKTALGADCAAAGNIQGQAVTADVDHQAANFDRWPLPEDQTVTRLQGPILIEGETGAPGVPSEWAWYTNLNNANPIFPLAVGNRGLFGTPASAHSAGQRILQPRTWYYVLSQGLVGLPGALVPPPGPVAVYGDVAQPSTNPPPGGAFLVVDEEWMEYDSLGAGQFNLRVLDGKVRRGVGDTAIVAHKAGTPVTVAREHPRYPGFYYTVQFYPVNATGAESEVIVSVAYGKDARFRVHLFPSIYNPAKF
jgi:Tfp pilus assembly protein PilV